MSANGHARGASERGVLERPFDVPHRLREHDRPAVHLRIEARLRRELGEAVEREVYLHGAAAGLPALDGGDEVLRELLPLDVLEERNLRVRRRDHGLGVDLLSPFEHDAGRAPAVHEDALDRCARPDRRAERLRRAPHRLRHAPHSPLGEPPHPHLPFADVADLVMRHHVRGARRARTGPRADDAAHRERPLQLRTTRNGRRGDRRRSSSSAA